MMMSGAVGAGPMRVPPLFGVVLNLEGAHLLVGHLRGVKTLKYATLMNVLLLQRMLHRVVNELILKVLLLIDLMLRTDGAAYNIIREYYIGLRHRVYIHAREKNSRVSCYRHVECF